MQSLWRVRCCSSPTTARSLALICACVCVRVCVCVCVASLGHNVRTCPTLSARPSTGPSAATVPAGTGTDMPAGATSDADGDVDMGGATTQANEDGDNDGDNEGDNDGDNEGGDEGGDSDDDKEQDHIALSDVSDDEDVDAGEPMTIPKHVAAFTATVVVVAGCIVPRGLDEDGFAACLPASLGEDVAAAVWPMYYHINRVADGVMAKPKTPQGDDNEATGAVASTGADADVDAGGDGDADADAGADGGAGAGAGAGAGSDAGGAVDGAMTLRTVTSSVPP